MRTGTPTNCDLGLQLVPNAAVGSPQLTIADPLRPRQRHLLLGEREQRRRHVVPRAGHLLGEPDHRRAGGRVLGDGPADRRGQAALQDARRVHCNK